MVEAEMTKEMILQIKQNTQKLFEIEAKIDQLQKQYEELYKACVPKPVSKQEWQDQYIGTEEDNSAFY